MRGLNERRGTCETVGLEFCGVEVEVGQEEEQSCEGEYQEGLHSESAHDMTIDHLYYIRS